MTDTDIGVGIKVSSTGGKEAAKDIKYPLNAMKGLNKQFSKQTKEGSLPGIKWLSTPEAAKPPQISSSLGGFMSGMPTDAAKEKTKKDADAAKRLREKEIKLQEKINKTLFAGTKGSRNLTKAYRGMDGITKKVTATNMSFLGVMFGAMGVINVITRMITSLLSPISNLDGAFESWAMSMAFGADTLANVDFNPAEMVQGWMNLKGATSSFNAILASFGAKVCRSITPLIGICTGGLYILIRHVSRESFYNVKHQSSKVQIHWSTWSLFWSRSSLWGSIHWDRCVWVNS